MAELRHLLECVDRSNLGRRLVLAPGEGAQALLDVRGDDAAARDVIVTVTIEPTIMRGTYGPDEVAAGLDEVRARAMIEAGVAGHVAKLVLDVGTGLRFGAAVSSLRVSAVNDGGAPISVGAFVGYGTTPSAPTLSIFGPELALREQWLVAVPPFSRSVEVLRPADHELVVEVALGRTDTASRWIYGDHVPFDRRMAPLPLANGCRLIRVTSVSSTKR